MSQTLDNIELRSEAVQDILSSPPTWMVRYGISIIFACMMLLLLVAYFIKYPDVISSKAIITLKNPPERIESKVNSRIVKLVVTNSQNVEAKQFIGILESSANYEHVFQLKQELEKINTSQTRFYFPFEKLKNLQLGDVQSNFIQFQKNYIEHELNQRLLPFSNEISSANRTQSENSNRLNALYNQQKLEKAKFNLATQQLERATHLFKEGVISAYELEKEKVNHLQAKQTFDQTNMSISQQKDAINQTSKQIKSNQITQQKTDVTNLSSLYQSLDELKKSIKIWEQNYVLTASYSGVIKFQNSWKENQLIKTGDLFATIIPTQKTEFSGSLQVPIQNTGKIKNGQKVLLKLDNYPFEEFGMLEGKIITMSSVPDKEGNFYIEISLNNGLNTTYNKKLKFDKELTGTGEIITEELRLIERLFYQFRKLVFK